MDNDGWIKLHRKVTDNPIWLSEPFTHGQAWVDLIVIANHSTGHIRIRGILVEVIRGQVGYSEQSLAERWKWSRGKVRRFLSYLKTSSQISRNPVQQNKHISSLITITNYDEYQSSGTTSGTTNGQQTDNKWYSNKNVKNVKNEKKVNIYNAEFETFWSAYPNKKEKPYAFKCWQNLNGARPPIEEIVKSIDRQKAWRKDADGFRPEWKNPATWINKGCWDDIPEIEKEKSRWDT